MEVEMAMFAPAKGGEGGEGGESEGEHYRDSGLYNIEQMGEEGGVAPEIRPSKGPEKKVFNGTFRMWSEGEDACLREGVSIHGRSWATIKRAYELDRSQSAISNRWAYLNGRRPGKGGSKGERRKSVDKRGKADILDEHVVKGFIAEDDDFLYF
ncbi:hypothetical protein TrCOL_g6420 [Triparma columacea]|uniref:Myb-like domain-containing protein n=1 Tax=Triparma columacea TaxID=722753 RepID=A0A9W7LE43_9STRA|nr:hypothetical protein TrCOL_g6420 [Triparma columacea]